MSRRSARSRRRAVLCCSATRVHAARGRHPPTRRTRRHATRHHRTFRHGRAAIARRRSHHATRSSRLHRTVRASRKPERAEPVVHADHDHLLLVGEPGAVVDRLAGASDHERSAREPDEHGKRSRSASGAHTLRVRHRASSVTSTRMPGTISPSGLSVGCGAAGPNAVASRLGSNAIAVGDSNRARACVRDAEPATGHRRMLRACQASWIHVLVPLQYQRRLYLSTKSCPGVPLAGWVPAVVDGTR